MGNTPATKHLGGESNMHYILILELENTFNAISFVTVKEKKPFLAHFSTKNKPNYYYFFFLTYSEFVVLKLEFMFTT